MGKTQVRSLGWKDSLEKEMATHSSILAWKIPWTEEPGRLYSSWGHKELDMTEHLHFHFLFFFLVSFTQNLVLTRSQEYSSE